MDQKRVDFAESVMATKEKILIFDTDEKRRAQICYLLKDSGYYAEPCSDTCDYSLRFPQRGTILVKDEGEAIAEVLAALHRHATWLPIIAYAESPQPESVVRALSEGAVDYLSWPFEITKLAAHLEKLDSRFAALQKLRVRGLNARHKLNQLTKRERQVLDCMSEGNTSKAIADELGISPRTVEIHRAAAIRKLGANSTVDAVRIAIEDKEAELFGPGALIGNSGSRRGP